MILALEKKYEKKLNNLAYYDYLTGAVNRAKFDEIVKSALDKSIRHNRKLAIILIDIDDFKTINDSYGHKTGDRLLIETVTRIKKILRKYDVLARVGGDEFIILAEEIKSTADALIIANKILTTMSSKFNIEKIQFNISVSIGVAIYPDDGENLEKLIHNADVAMYNSKKSGKNKFSVFNTNYYKI